LFFGFFFDGTRNNYIQDEGGKSQSNVARLYDCYPGLSVPGVLPDSAEWQYQREDYSHFFKVYVPGIASPFRKVNDSGKGIDALFGGAGGAMGERRIIWALLQAINNVHRYFCKVPLITQSEIERLLRIIVLTKLSRGFMEAKVGPDIPGRVEWRARCEFASVLLRLHSAVRVHWRDERTGKPQKIDPGVVQTIYISTFGFSRGATEARAFTNWLQSLCKLDSQLRGKARGMSLGGFNVEFDFLGLFDSVASIGFANSLRIADGHGAWADAEDSLRVPQGVKCLHLVAAHELRRSFPVDSISVNGTLPDGCQEIVIPGVHSDVGGGYCPCEQGRGSDRNGDDMLSRIPLLMMYKTARLNGVPLKLELAASAAKGRFALKAETIEAFNAYLGTCKETHGPIHRIMREQARKQMEWRLARRIGSSSSLETTTSYRRASTFHQNDLRSAAVEFEQEITEFEGWLKGKGPTFRPASQPVGFRNERNAEWEEIAGWWKKGPPPSIAVSTFFDIFVHDSRAAFKTNAEPDNEKDMHTLLRRWNEKAMPSVAGKADYKSMTAGLSAEQQRAAHEYAETGRIPQMRTGGRESRDLCGAGYLRFRKIYGGMDSELLS
jgi:Uncharacterized alpha/beta hydrolase domain (DUF2235)